MKKISLILLIAGMIWKVQTAQAQTQDTTKNKVEVKKKVKKGAHGRTVTKIKMTGTGTPDAINGAADGAVTGHLKPANTSTGSGSHPSAACAGSTSTNSSCCT